MRMEVFLTTQFRTIWMRGNKDKEIKETLYFIFARFVGNKSHLPVSYIISDFWMETHYISNFCLTHIILHIIISSNC